jgi:hypothetical protein
LVELYNNFPVILTVSILIVEVRKAKKVIERHFITSRWE